MLARLGRCMILDASFRHSCTSAELDSQFANHRQLGGDHQAAVLDYCEKSRECLKSQFLRIPDDAKCIPISRTTYMGSLTRRFRLKSRGIEFFPWPRLITTASHKCVSE